MYRRPFLYIPWTLHAAICTCTCTDQCTVKGGSIENHSYGNSTCTESCQRNTVSFTQCVYMHKSVGVWFECSSDFKLQGITYEVTATIEGQDARLHALDGILLTWFNFSEWLHDSWCYTSHHLQMLPCWHQHLLPTMSVLHHGDPHDSPHTMELCCPGREWRNETNETYTCHTTTSMYMYSIMQACERDGTALMDTDYTSMDNSKVILCWI